MEKFTLLKDNDRKILQRNGKSCVCPFRNPVIIPVQTMAGNQLQISHIECSDDCPLFKLNSFGDGLLSVRLTCSSDRLVKIIES